MAKKPKPAKRGRKAAIFDYARIAELSGMGLTREEIGLALGYKRTCFYKHKAIDGKIEQAILNGRAKFKVFLSATLVKQAQGGNVTAAIWLDKTRCGTKEDRPDDDNQMATPVKVVIEVIDASKGAGKQTTGAVPGATE